MGLSIHRRRKRWQTERQQVSVPSRGNGVIDSCNISAQNLNRGPSFRPLSGKWGYRYVHRSGQAGVQPPHVSVPSRGNGVINSRDDTYAVHYVMELEFPSPLGDWRHQPIMTCGTMPAAPFASFRPLSGRCVRKQYRQHDINMLPNALARRPGQTHMGHSRPPLPLDAVDNALVDPVVQARFRLPVQFEERAHDVLKLHAALLFQHSLR